MDKKWIHEGITDEAIEWAKELGEDLAKKVEKDGKVIIKALTTSQLRKFFGELKRIDSDFDRKKGDLPMLQPMLAYAVGRDKNEKGKNKSKIDIFEEKISESMKAIRQNKENHKSDFKNFVKLVEAIVAYHKYYGGE